MREDARATVQFYFREVRTPLEGIGVEADKIADIDRKMQHMIELAAGINRKSTYLGIIRELAKLRAPLTAAIEIRASTKNAPVPAVLLSQVEAAILLTLDKICRLRLSRIVKRSRISQIKSDILTAESLLSSAKSSAKSSIISRLMQT